MQVGVLGCTVGHRSSVASGGSAEPCHCVECLRIGGGGVGGGSRILLYANIGEHLGTSEQVRARSFQSTSHPRMPDCGNGFGLKM